MRFFSFVIICFLSFTYMIFAQITYPAPFDLSGGNYVFTEWSPSNPSGTYPTSMIFHRTSTQDPLLSTEMTTNYTGAYNLTSGSRINGLGTSGFSFVNTSTAGNLGAAVLALNTLNRTNIQVTWTGGFVRIAGTTTREYRIRLQYKIGDSGSFQDVTDANGNPVEYIYNEYVGHPNPTTLPPHSQTFTVYLPSSVEDQPIVYLRWKYYFLGSGSGNRPELRIDDIYVMSESSVGGGTRLKISDISPLNPLTNIPFSLRVSSIDDNGVAKKVSQPTVVRLSLISGSGALLGTLIKTIPFKSTSVTFDDLTYNFAENITIGAEVISGDPLASTQENLQVLPGPIALVIEELYTKLHTNSIIPTFKVRAINSDNSTNPYYHNYTAKVTFDGPLTFAFNANFVNGVATFTNVQISVPGTYQVFASAPGFSSSNVIQVDVKPVPTLTEIFVPKYLKGVGTFGTRVPTFALVKMENLHPNTVYRYFTGGRNVGYTGDVNTDNGAGNNLHYNHQTDSYSYNSIRDLNQDNAYSTFESESDGTKLVWLTLVPTTNSSFNEGRQVYWIMVLGSEKGTLIKRYQTTNTSLSLDFGNPPTKCTGIYDEDSWLPPKSFVCLFDSPNVNMPVSIAIVQNEGATLQDGIDPQGNPYPPQGPDYYNNLDDVVGAWATIIPNNLDNGIRKIEVYNRNGKLIKRIYDLDGIWAGVNTIQVYGGSSSPISFKTPAIKLVQPAEGFSDDFCNEGHLEIQWVSRGVSKIDIDVSIDRGNSFFNIIEDAPANEGKAIWRIPRGLFADTTNRLKIYDREHPTSLAPLEFLSSSTNDFYIYDTPIITAHTKSGIACLGEDVVLTAYATGSKLGYQWYKDGKKLYGATSQQLILRNVNFATSGVYTCEATGASVCSSDFTDKILVYVLTQTNISIQPKDFYGYLGSIATFNFDVHAYEFANGDISIQWYRNGQPLRDDWKYSGTKSNYFTVNNITYSDTNDYFFAIVNGRCGADTTNIVKIRIVPNILIKPDTLYICDKDSYLNVPISVPHPILPQNYIVEFYRGSILVGSFNLSVFGMSIRLPIVSLIPGDYYAIIRVPSLDVSFKTNIVKIVKIDKPPVITKDLPDQLSLKAGDELNLSIDAEGLNLHYQWFKDDMPLPSAIEPNLLITNVSTDDAGRYYCLVWNCDTVKSNVVNVNITLFSVSSVEWLTLPDGAKFKLFPNPTQYSSELLIASNLIKEYKVEIFNTFGQSVFSQIVQTNGVDGSRIIIPFKELGLAGGVYNIKLETENKVTTIPVVYLP